MCWDISPRARVKIMEDAVKEAADAVMEAVEEGIGHAMNSHNRKRTARRKRIGRGEEWERYLQIR